jgi:ABC-type branched-subunit amino acid transport system ATPase component
MTTALEVSGLTVRFGGLVALDDVSMTIGAGELVGLIGPNGAGKTTLLDAVTGFVRGTGTISMCGDRIDGLRPHQRAARGLARTFQSLELFEDLTVRENVALGGVSWARSAGLVGASGLGDVADQLPGTLPPSVRRVVALVRATAAGPRLLLVDEVAAGLDADERAVLGDRLRGIAADGTGVVLVDHDVGLVVDLSHRIVVLDGGRVIANGTPDDVRRDGRVIDAYLGSAQ